jgi:hypothetical protein
MKNTGVARLEDLIHKFKGYHSIDIENLFGVPQPFSDSDTLFYNRSRGLFFSEEIAFVIKNFKVVDITLTDCFLGLGYRNVFFFENETPEYIVGKIKFYR